MRTSWFVVLGLFGGCELSGGTPGGFTQPVTLLITVDNARFAPAASLDVRVWNAEQLQILQSNARCAASHDAATGTPRVVCPDGVQYREVTPERFERPAPAAGSRLELKTAAIRVGERFRLRIAGLSRDNCNTTSADRVLDARSARVIVDNLEWQTTAKACLQRSAS